MTDNIVKYGYISHQGYNNDLSCSISYNINGQATHRSTPFLTEDIWYGNGAVPQYSGKISGKDIYSGGRKQSYSYSYDKLGRLTDAAYTDSQDAAADFSASYSYDLEANPTVITRMGLTDVDTYGLLNHIRVDYHNGQVLGVADDADAPVLEGTLTGPVPVIKVTHRYDANGNLIKDATRGIDSIRYNVLNLPETVYFSNGYRLSYIYLADGTKLRETRRRPTFSVGAGSAGVITETTDYIGAYEYENGVPRRLNLPGGYLTLADSVYHHYIPDYQGNILAVVNTRTRQVEQRTNYYPYGMPHGNATGAGLNKRKYSGKELITFAGYDAMDYHARWRPTSLPLFSTPDLCAEKYYPISMYSYCAGDPINATDSSGMLVEDPDKVVEKFKIYANRVIGDMKDRIKKEQKRDSDVTPYNLVIQFYNRVLSEINTLENSSQIYRVYDNSQGMVYYDAASEKIMIGAEINNFPIVVHELHHGYQYEMGKLSILVTNDGYGSLYDIYDEVESYNYDRAVNFGINYFLYPYDMYEGYPIKMNAEDIYTMGAKMPIPAYQMLPKKKLSLGSGIGKQLRKQTKQQGKQGLPIKEVYKGWQKDYYGR